MIGITAKVHGRVSLIGEHTDYNGGWVLLAPIPQSMTIKITLRRDNEVHASTSALHLPGSNILFFKLGEESRKNNWIDYVQGATKLLADLGHKLSGFDVRIESHVPTHSGLASSSALVIGILKALSSTFS